MQSNSELELRSLKLYPGRYRCKPVFDRVVVYLDRLLGRRPWMSLMVLNVGLLCFPPLLMFFCA